jgi:hypothetical protein
MESLTTQVINKLCEEKEEFFIDKLYFNCGDYWREGMNYV